MDVDTGTCIACHIVYDGYRYRHRCRYRCRDRCRLDSKKLGNMDVRCVFFLNAGFPRFGLGGWTCSKSLASSVNLDLSFWDQRHCFLYLQGPGNIDRDLRCLFPPQSRCVVMLLVR